MLAFRENLRYPAVFDFFLLFMCVSLSSCPPELLIEQFRGFILRHIESEEMYPRVHVTFHYYQSQMGISLPALTVQYVRS